MIDLPKIRLENFEKVREQYGTAAELARALERSPQQINDMLAGKKSFGPRIARYIEEKLNLGKGFLDEPHELTGTKISRSKKIPVLSFVQAGLPTDSGDNSYDEWIDVGDDVPDNAYALTIKGSSMKPVFHEGETVIVNPDLSPRPGDYVVARIDNGCMNEATMKQYAVTGFDKYGRETFELRPLNPLYPTLSSQELQLQLCGVVVECRKRFR